MGGEDGGWPERQATDWPSAANHADGIHREKLNPWVVEKLKKLNQARSRLRLYRNQILEVKLVGKLSPRSTQCTPLHRSLSSIFSSKIAKNISRLNI